MLGGKEAGVAGAASPCEGACAVVGGAWSVVGLCPPSGSGAGVWASGDVWVEAGSVCSAAGLSEGVASGSASTSAPDAGAETRGGRKLSGSR